MLSLNIFISIILGIITGYYFIPSNLAFDLGILIDIGLMLLLFLVGIDIGKQAEGLKKIKLIGFKILLIPGSIIVGSIVGSMLAGKIFLNMSINESGAVGAGLGWYTLSSTILLSEGYIELSTLAFLSNVFREVIALIGIPIIAKYIGNIEALSTAGATSMDTALPIISKFTDSETAIIAFMTGVICTASVPLILPIILQL